MCISAKGKKRKARIGKSGALDAALDGPPQNCQLVNLCPEDKKKISNLITQVCFAVRLQKYFLMRASGGQSPERSRKIRKGEQALPQVCPLEC